MEYPTKLMDFQKSQFNRKKNIFYPKIIPVSIVAFSSELYSGVHCWSSELSVPEIFFFILTNPFQKRGVELSLKESNILKNEKMLGFSERTNLVIANHPKSFPSIFSKCNTSCWWKHWMIILKIWAAERCYCKI